MKIQWVPSGSLGDGLWHSGRGNSCGGMSSNHLANHQLATGKRLHSYGKSPFFYGKIHYKLPFSIAMLNYQRVATNFHVTC